MFTSKFIWPEFMDEIFGKDFAQGVNQLAMRREPFYNLYEREDSFVIEIAAPGLDKGDFRIDLNDKALAISASKPAPEQGPRYIRREFDFSSFRRVFNLSDQIDTEAIAAKHENGVLRVSLPKRSEQKPKGPQNINIV